MSIRAAKPFHTLLFLSLLPAMTSALAATHTYSLDSLDPAYVEQDRGVPHIGVSVDGQPMVVGGQRFTHGIGTHANSKIEFRLDGKAAEFTATVGASDRQAGTLSKVIFVVQGDGRELWNSGPMTPGMPPQPVSVKLDGVRDLVLLVNQGGDRIDYDDANWADAAISYSGAAPAPVGSIISLVTDHSQYTFGGWKGGAVKLISAGLRDGSWTSPFEGLAWPGQSDLRDHDAPVAIQRANGDSALNLVFVKQETTRESDDVQHVVVTLEDKVDPIRVEVHFRVFAHEDVIQQWAVLHNGMPGPLTVQRLDSIYFEAPSSSNPHVEWYDSKWANEAAKPQHVKLAEKGRLIIEGRGGERHIEGPVPAFILSFGDFAGEDKTPCIIAALGWSGSARMSFDMDHKKVLAVTAGMSPEAYPTTLAPGAAFTSPMCVYALSANGKGAASRSLQAWGRKYGLRNGDRERLVDNNSWEGCGFNVAEQPVRDMMKGSAQMGIEVYVLDDGWFGNGPNARTGDHSGLGDWQVNRERFPNGLKPVIEEGAKDGIKFGIWFEPEMVNPASDLFTRHPDWVLRSPGRELVSSGTRRCSTLPIRRCRNLSFTRWMTC